MKKANSWLFEEITPDFYQIFGIEKMLFSGRTRYQKVEIFENQTFGKCLVLDGKIQSAEKDEYIYHEALVHPAMILHPDPQVVFIGGGGEGATLREVLKHSTVRRAVMVDIDEEVVALCRKHLPSFSAGAFEDPRAEVIYMDAWEYFEKAGEAFDVAILDFSDPVPEGPSVRLFTREFFGMVESKLREEGIVVLQAGPASAGFTDLLASVVSTLRTIFPVVNYYSAEVPSFGGEWGFALGSKKHDLFSLSPEEVALRIRERVRGELKFYDEITHRRFLSPPKHLREAVREEIT